MRKRLVLLLLLKLSGLWLHNATAQSQLSFENYYSMSSSGPLSIMPVASFQGSKGFYAEGRYNYEELNTLSFYMGRTFSKESNFSYSFSPIAGVVIGEFNGGSVGANISMGYKNFYLYSQPQYTFAVENSINNFIYSWTDITYSPLSWLSVGVSFQHTKPKQSKGFLENGLVIETAYKKFTFPMYIFNPQSKDRSFVLGANFDISFKKKKAERKDSEPLKDIYPVNILANSADANKVVQPEVSSKPISDNIIKVRRVNVLVRQKTEEHNFENNFNAIPEKNNGTLKSAGKIEAPIKKEKNAGQKPVIKTNAALIKPEKIVPAIVSNQVETVKETGHVIYYALLLGPFKAEADALLLKSKLNAVFNRDIILYSEGAQYKLRIAGFENQADAEIFSLNASHESANTIATIIPYKVKNIDAVPLKGEPKPFEATQL